MGLALLAKLYLLAIIASTRPSVSHAKADITSIAIALAHSVLLLCLAVSSAPLRRPAGNVKPDISSALLTNASSVLTA